MDFTEFSYLNEIFVWNQLALMVSNENYMIKLVINASPYEWNELLVMADTKKNEFFLVQRYSFVDRSSNVNNKNR